MPAQGTSNSQARKDYKFNPSDDLNIDSDNDTSEFYWAEPVDVTRVGFIVTTAVTNAANTVDVEVYVQNEVGDGGLDTKFTTWRVTDTTTLAKGAVAVCDMVGEVAAAEQSDGSILNVGPSGPIRVNPGQSLVLKVVEPADAGVVIPFVEYISHPLIPTAHENVTVGSEV